MGILPLYLLVCDSLSATEKTAKSLPHVTAPDMHSHLLGSAPEQEKKTDAVGECSVQGQLVLWVGNSTAGLQSCFDCLQHQGRHALACSAASP